MAPDLFAVGVLCYYKLLRLLHFTDLYYNATLKRLEFQPRYSRLRRVILKIYYSIFGIYATYFITILLLVVISLTEEPDIYTTLEVVSVAYVTLVLSMYMATFLIISHQIRKKKTQKFLKQFFNKLFEMHQNILRLTGQHVVMEIPTALLLMVKLIFIVWILFASWQITSYVRNLAAFPIFELAFIANYLVIARLLKLQQELSKWIENHEAQYSFKFQCTAACKTSNYPILKAISLWSQSCKITANFLNQFIWYEKLVLLENIFCIYLSHQFIVCIFFKQYYHGALLPDALNHTFNMLLIGMVNDSLKYEEDSLNNTMTALVAKLTHQTRLCKSCRDLQRAIDICFCCRNVRSNGIYIFGSFWTRGYVIDIIQSLVLLGVSITQFDTQGTYNCNFDPEYLDTFEAL
ncbi:uncharacterized protein LOC126754102 [Bactrocera neohumeralis]|uniref:uncharacterized protein LOC126754102 n=1 Tax=Bactrocera neohumeralis TaxID=98809 RepID=UPI0021657215|nr:uncharacterized protein LOC126754102 [Bactrocera neohumeralis]